MSAAESISIKENSLLITKIISVCHFWKITLSIKLKKFCLLPSSSNSLLLFKTSISVTSLSMGLANSFKFIISAIFCLFMSVEFSSLISYFTIFAPAIKFCRATSFISTSSCFIFIFIFSFLSFSFSFFRHSVTWCPYFLHLIQAIGISIESFNFSKYS